MKNRLLFIAAIGLPIILALVVALRLVQANDSGSLVVHTNSSSAAVSYATLNQKPLIAGKGKLVSARLPSGTYEVRAKADGKESAATAVIKKGQTTELNMNLRGLVALQRVALYTASDILPADDGSLLFVNDPIRLLFRYAPGANNATPYLENLYPVDSVFWLNSQQGYANNNQGDWSFINGSSATPLGLKGSEGPVLPSAVSINNKGQVAYVVDKALYLLASPGAAPRKIDTLGRDSWAPVLADNGNILVFDTNESAEGKAIRHQHSRYYNNGNRLDLPGALDYITNAAWSSNANNLVFSTTNGLWLYNLSNGTAAQYFNETLTDVSSSVWVDSHRLLLVQANSIWLLDVSAGYSSKLAALPGSPTSSHPFSFSSDKKTVYIGTSPGTSAGSGYIYSFKL